MTHLNEIDSALAKGGVCILPTETVYGLAGKADSPEAIDKIYALKGRDFSKPLAVCVRVAGEASRYGEMTRLALDLANAFWPGPLTLVVPARTPLAFDTRVYGAEGGAPTIALRCPASVWAPYLSSMPLALTSANRSGEPETHSAEDAHAALGSNVDGVFHSAPHTAGGTPSTIVSVSDTAVQLLRDGAITAEQFAPFDIEWSPS